MTARQLAVLVPTVNRASFLVPLVKNIHEATSMSHQVYLVMERWDEDSAAAWRQTDATAVIGDYGSNATAVNAGYRASFEPFVAILNDDVVCHAGWDTAAHAHFTDRIHAVGINQGNGGCQSFSMVRRSFIEEHSGVFDRPNTLYHEYLSQYPDTEFALYAQHRGVWADAFDALVEHMHPDFGKGDPTHPNYLKRAPCDEQDQPEFFRRREQWMRL